MNPKDFGPLAKSGPFCFSASFLYGLSSGQSSDGRFLVLLFSVVILRSAVRDEGSQRKVHAPSVPGFARTNEETQMIISMKLHATREEIDAVTAIVKHFGYKVH
ncbi:MAG TPA: hypothetical protein VMT75_00885, partial [Candidatus Saccharimonadales bacterium]|nr:hypothetical protein [Candidatus Saccharimonadales bacterium]